MLLRRFAVLLLGLFASQAFSQTDLAPPNFVIILCDDLGWGDLACYGHPHIKTPNLDRMAGEGIRYTSFYSAAPVCSPSRVGLLTGRNPNRAGVYDWIPHFDQSNQSGQQSRHLVHMRMEEVTLPQILKTAGYATAMAGKWHCNAIFNHKAQPQPGDAGFDSWFATQNNASPSHENPVNYVRNGKETGPLKGYSCQLAAQEAIGWLERQQKEKPDQPFFIFLPFHEPHEPVASPPDLVAAYLDKARNEDEAQYFANVENMDRAVGAMLAALDRLQLKDNTLVVFTSDNGPETLKRYPASKRSYGTPGDLRGMKLWTTEAGYRVPGIVRWPAKIKPGQTSDIPVSSLDLLPTFASLAKAQTPATLQLDGMDVTAVLEGAPVARSKPLFWVYYNAINDQRVALRDGDWKILAKLDHGEVPKITNITEATAAKVREARLTDFSLYKLSDDIQEAHDLGSTEPVMLKEMTAKLEAAYREMVSSMHIWPDQPRPGPDHK